MVHRNIRSILSIFFTISLLAVSSGALVAQTTDGGTPSAPEAPKDGSGTGGADGGTTGGGTGGAGSGGTGNGAPIQSDWSGVKPSLYNKGDQTFVISLGTIIPTVFFGSSGTFSSNLSVGGTGYLNYNYFINSNVSLGGEVGGMFAGTLGKNMLYMIPFGFRATYQFIAGRFEFPLSLTLGAASEGYLNEGYFGLFLKPSAAVYWRFSPEWSFGLGTAWWWVPQWVSDSSQNSYGNFLDISLSARYHF